MKHILLVLAALVALSMSATAAPDAAAIVAADLKAALPGYAIVAVDPATLKVGPPGHADMVIALDRMLMFCSVHPDRCEATLHDFAAKAATTVRSQNDPVDPASLRAGIREAGYVAGVARQLAGSAKDATLVTQPIAGGLVAVCYFDRPTSRRLTTSADLAALHMTAAETMAVCQKNIRAVLRPLAGELQASDDRPIHVLGGQEYASSYILFPQDWADLAAKLGGKLIVAVPEPDVILYGPDDRPDAVAMLHKLAEEGSRSADRPVSTAVLRWTPNGWVPAAP